MGDVFDRVKPASPKWAVTNEEDVRATHDEPTMGGSDVRETPTVRPTEASAGSLQRSQAGEPRPSGESGTRAAKEGRAEPETSGELNLVAGESGTSEPGKLAEVVRARVAVWSATTCAPGLKPTSERANSMPRCTILNPSIRIGAQCRAGHENAPAKRTARIWRTGG